jgi:hypothetical protein
MTAKLAPTFLVFCLVLTGCSGKKDGDKKDADGSEKEKKSDDPGPKPPDKKSDDASSKPPGKPDFTLTSQEFSKQRKKDDTPFRNKSIELTGTMKYLSFRSNGEPYFALEGTSGDTVKPDPDDTIIFPADPAVWKKALPGQTVTVRGKWEFPYLQQSEVVSVKGEPPPTVTTDALAEDFAKDGDAADKKYKGKSLILDGEISKVGANNDEGITLKTSKASPRIVLTWDNDDWENLSKYREKSLKVGTKVKLVKGASFDLDAGKEQVIISFPTILEPAR